MPKRKSGNSKSKIDIDDFSSDDDLSDETDVHVSSKSEKKMDKHYDRMNEIESKRFREKIKHKKEDSSTTEGVIDLSTSKEIYKLQKQYFKGLGGIISTGKESNVYYTKSLDLNLTHNIEELAIKVYRTRTLDFKKIKKYIEGDIRFSKIGSKSHQIMQTWALKEFKNLSRAFDTNIPVPKPIVVKRNVLVMEFMGEKGIAAPQLRTVANSLESNILNDFYFQAITIMDNLWNKTKLVHGDLSSYNILVKKDVLYAIDFGQGLITDHHLAESFLWRDIRNILYFFDNSNVEINTDEPEEIFEKITGKKAIPEFLEM